MIHDFKQANADFVTDCVVVGGDLDEDDGMAVNQAAELVDIAGVTHVLDVRLEANDSTLWGYMPDVAYLWEGMDDAGQDVPDEWWDRVTDWAVSAIIGGGRILVHCHMGINRSPSVVFAVLLTMGWEPAEAMGAIRSARPIANAWYAEQALCWHLKRTQAPPRIAALAHRQLAAWRRDHPLDVIRVIKDVRERHHDW